MDGRYGQCFGRRDIHIVRFCKESYVAIGTCNERAKKSGCKWIFLQQAIQEQLIRILELARTGVFRIC